MIASHPQEGTANLTILVLFGATGDLVRRKIVPALFRLFERRMLPSGLEVVGFSRRPLTDASFGDYIAELLREAFPTALRKRIDEFAARFFYVRGFFDKPSGYRLLSARLAARERARGACVNKLLYLAVPPVYYQTIFKWLAASQLAQSCNNKGGEWTRVVVEKPFGNDYRTAERLDALLGRLFDEDQIYRIDHYLGKETVQNILAFRFSNSFLEPAWDNDSIERIHIRALEAADIEGRGAYYDGVGALRDMGQNHLLQLLALFTMENPKIFDASHIRAERERVLRALRLMNADEVHAYTVRAQYAGYRNERGVAPHSRTETYFRIRAFLDTPRWRGVPLCLESGKKLPEKRTEVEVVFRHPIPCLCPPEGSTSAFAKASADMHYRNVLRYEIYPHERITTAFWVKRPGPKMTLEEKNFFFSYARAYPKAERIDEYERLFLDAVGGSQTLFVSTEEIKASWRFIDPIVRAWRRGASPILSYWPGSGDIMSRAAELIERGLRREIGIVGLGKMGRNMAIRLKERKWRVLAYDVNPPAVKEARSEGIEVVSSLSHLTAFLAPPRIVWLMVPAAVVEEALFGSTGIVRVLDRGDIVIDGGNSFFENTVRRARRMRRYGIMLLDAGVSGGPRGARYGASIMVGGDYDTYLRLEPLFRDLAMPGGYDYMGKNGAGHFVKMMHNGIEYGMMQAIAEGFTAMKRSPYKLDLKRVADLYNRGTVIDSRLIEWFAAAVKQFGENLRGVSGSVAYTGEGAWAVETARRLKVPMPIIEGAVKFRVRSKNQPSYTGQILMALRHQFGGHSVRDERKERKRKRKAR